MNSKKTEERGLTDLLFASYLGVNFQFYEVKESKVLSEFLFSTAKTQKPDTSEILRKKFT